MRCAKCNTDNRDTAQFCDKCGARLSRRCPSCGAENRPDARFCDACGAALEASAAAAAKQSPAEKSDDAPLRLTVTPTAENLDGERKTVTALFADIKGSTELMEDLDPEEARAIIDPALKLMIDSVRRYDGYVVQSTGDGIFALFGAPVAHEGHPQSALYAALRMQDELRRYSARLVAEGGTPVQCRVGASTGEVVVRTIQTGAGQVEYTPIGHTTNLASRMQTAAPVGSIAVSESTRRLCQGYFILKPQGATRVKGVSEPVNVYEVTGLGPLRTRLQRAAGRGLTKFVGRAHEMEALKRGLEQAKAGRGQIVAAMAEPGVGKSRLFFEFKTVSESGCMVLETFSVSHGKASAYLPLLDLLHGYFKVTSDDDPRTRREKVTGRVVALDRNLEDTLPYLFSLLGIVEGDDPLAHMDGQIKKRRTLDAIKRILLRESLNQPLMVIFEDLHWIDEQTQAFLNLLVDSIGATKILLLVNYRPEYSHQWGNKTYYTQLRLEPLGREGADEMIAALLGNDRALAPLRHLIIERTEGNPFFVEEMIQALFEQGVLARNGTVQQEKPLSEVKVPATVQSVLASRIDRLALAEKDLLQTLAVIGREFSGSLLRRVAATADDDLQRMLAGLQLGEFIYEQPAAGDIEYAFKHALTQEVAYNSLLMERRKRLHERAAQALEALTADRSDCDLARIAHHYSRSENNTKAIEYLIRAGEQAIQRSTVADAARYFEDALARLKELPPDTERDRKELAVHTGLADVTIVTSGYAAPEYERHLARRHELAKRLGDATQLFYSLVGASVLSAFRLELSKAREIGGRLLALADQALDRQMQLEAHGSLANILWMLGDFRGSREHSQAGLALFPLTENLPAGKEHMRAACLEYASFCEVVLGLPDEGLRRSLDFLTWARGRAQPLPLAIALNCVSTVYGWRREGMQELKHAEALLVLTEEEGFSNWHSFAQIERANSLALLGKGHEAIAEIKSAIASYEASGAVVPGWMHQSLALSYLTVEQPAEGLSVVTKALDVGDQTGDGEATPELHRLKGELLLMCDPAATIQAENSFRAAVSAAREQEARFPELRATTSLARLLRNTGRRDEARAMLAEIYNWFTEGFDTADLKDAKALLDELSK